MDRNWAGESETKKFAVHGWIGLGLIITFWILNWNLEGVRTNWAFFPLWLGYCLTVDALVLYRTGTSLLTRSWHRYIGLFLVSAPVWWLFELINLRLQNWRYIGAESFSPLAFAFWSTLNFTVVIPAVFGSSELIHSFGFFRRRAHGPVIPATRAVTSGFFIAGLIMIALMVIWPKIFFPFAWISVFFILEPINAWTGNPSLWKYVDKGDWRPILTLWGGVLLTGFFWEMWNYFSYPKWIYQIGWGDWFKIFEMPLLGYGGYLPFALELFAIYRLINGWFGSRQVDYVCIGDDEKS